MLVLSSSLRHLVISVDRIMADSPPKRTHEDVSTIPNIDGQYRATKFRSPDGLWAGRFPSGRLREHPANGQGRALNARSAISRLTGTSGINVENQSSQGYKLLPTSIGQCAMEDCIQGGPDQPIQGQTYPLDDFVFEPELGGSSNPDCGATISSEEQQELPSLGVLKFFQLSCLALFWLAIMCAAYVVEWVKQSAAGAVA
ncbi:unnamed protein product [Peniophora sp. CBMAI 1063]|nr:unnamed protein product [Peniophora sp. CBMAI 1063]